ncbi:MAG TPA: hypothetical protein VFW44_09395, partial [Bryobacteraceae bacterium]|nr:hypothetical protein [Bryobacteraceae bacterium]
MKLLSKALLIAVCGAAYCAASTVYVGASFGLFRSTDSGASWTQVNIPINNALLSKIVNPLSIVLDP